MKLKPMFGWEGLYSIRDGGDVFSHITNKFIITRKSPQGYNYVRLKGLKYVSTHRALMLTFKFHEDHINLQVNHKDLDKSNNYLDNLEWVTPKENSIHYVKSGGGTGERNGMSKLTEHEVIEILELRKYAVFTTYEIAEMYSVNAVTIQYIFNGTTWKHLRRE